MRRKLADQTAPALLTRLSIGGFERRRSHLSSWTLAKMTSSLRFNFFCSREMLGGLSARAFQIAGNGPWYFRVVGAIA